MGRRARGGVGGRGGWSSELLTFITSNRAKLELRSRLPASVPPVVKRRENRNINEYDVIDVRPPC